MLKSHVYSYRNDLLTILGGNDNIDNKEMSNLVKGILEKG